MEHTSPAQSQQGAPQGGRQPQRGRMDRRPPRQPRQDDGFKENVLDLRRVTRVVAGGKRMRFRATVVVGDLKGKVGVGIAKGLDVQAAVAKAKTVARRNLFLVPLKGKTIPHVVDAKFSAAEVRLRPAVSGHGIKAGGAVRVVVSLAGIEDITGKCLGRTPNKLTNALATLEALKKLSRESRGEKARATATLTP